MKVVRLQNPHFTSAAIVEHDTGTIYINALKFDCYTPFEQKFILFHEEGHYKLETHDEFKADEYAFKKLVGTERKSLKQLVAALENTLPFTTPEHELRYKAQLLRALRWDISANGNREAIPYVEKMTGKKYSAYNAEEIQALQLNNQLVSQKMQSGGGVNLTTQQIVSALFCVLAIGFIFKMLRK